MAAPHVAGTVALMWSAHRRWSATSPRPRPILDQTAVDTSTTSAAAAPRTTTTSGARASSTPYAAVHASPRGRTATLSGTITDAGHRRPDRGRDRHRRWPGTQASNLMATTNATGAYSLRLPAGTWTAYRERLRLQRPTPSSTWPSLRGSTTTRNVALVSQPATPLPARRNSFGAPLPGAKRRAQRADPGGDHRWKRHLHDLKGVPTGQLYVLRARLAAGTSLKRQNITMNGATTTFDVEPAATA